MASSSLFTFSDIQTLLAGCLAFPFGAEIGYIAPATHSMLPITQCPLGHIRQPWRDITAMAATYGGVAAEKSAFLRSISECSSFHNSIPIRNQKPSIDHRLVTHAYYRQQKLSHGSRLTAHRRPFNSFGFNFNVHHFSAHSFHSARPPFFRSHFGKNYNYL